MKYIVWHTARSGSNMLMSILHQTGVAGIRNFEECGYHVGYDRRPSVEFWQDNEIYFDKQITENGVIGCKAGFTYIDNLHKMTRNWNDIKLWVDQFDKHIVLTRLNKLAQSISAYFAGHTKQWHSDSPNTGIEPPQYNHCTIANGIARLAGEEERFFVYFEHMNIDYLHIYYEQLIDTPQAQLIRIMDYLGIRDEYQYLPSVITKQLHPLKTEYITRYKRDQAAIQIIKTVI